MAVTSSYYIHAYMGGGRGEKCSVCLFVKCTCSSASSAFISNIMHACTSRCIESKLLPPHILTFYPETRSSSMRSTMHIDERATRCSPQLPSFLSLPSFPRTKLALYISYKWLALFLICIRSFSLFAGKPSCYGIARGHKHTEPQGNCLFLSPSGQICRR